jgi:hypothetical protein
MRDLCTLRLEKIGFFCFFLRNGTTDWKALDPNVVAWRWGQTLFSGVGEGDQIGMRD